MKEIKMLHRSRERERNKQMRENHPCRPQGQYKRRAGDAPGRRAEVPLQPVEMSLVEQAVPLQPMVLTWSRSPCCSPPTMEEPPVEQVDVAWRRLQPMESPCRSRLLAGTVVHERNFTLGKSVRREEQQRRNAMN